MKTIKITDEDAQRLKLMAAKENRFIWQVAKDAVNGYMLEKHGRKAKGK